MKKIYLALPLAVLLFTACDPSEDDKSAPAAMSSEQMASQITITQDPANSNCVTLSTGGAGYVKVTDETGALVYQGTGGYFEVSPGGAADQTWTIERANFDGTTTSVKKSVTINQYLNVAPEWKFFTDMSSKTWTWDTGWRADGGAWGNMGYKAGDNASFVNDGNGIWWACAPADLSGQTAHSVSNRQPGEEDPNAYMVWSIAGKQIKCYDATGKEIRKGTFSFDMSTADDWKKGDLKTSAGSILFPFKINGNGKEPTSFEIMQIDDSKMKLVFAEPGTGSWSEATWWAFKKK